MSNTSEFFKTKKDWSIHKDNLLQEYLYPYFAKVLNSHRDIVFIDGFAGKGRFDDGTVGSPLIVKDAIYAALSRTTSDASIEAYFVDFSYADDLKRNLADETMHVISGDYRVEVPKILEQAESKNVFLYVDPFGIKYLDFNIFDSLKSLSFYSVELLLNLNAFGFVREACRLLKYKEVDADIPEYTYDCDNDKNSIDNMNRVANGTYWQEIIKGYNEGKYDIFEAEKLFLCQYIGQLKQCFKYVFQVPIKKGTSRLSKYRMVFATNHTHGALLMADDMIKCNNKIQDDAHGAQCWLFDYDYEKLNCKSDLLKFITPRFKDVKLLCIEMYETLGLKYYTKDIKNELKVLEKDGVIEIRRFPAVTKTGRVSTSMDIIKNKIEVRKV